ncbi:hypothetical protein [Mammaliicoccus lentus]|uniref:hypothetical protein n=1 Tax=Mammaliicoccus lentus TaxID=42858 RepID=UPI002DBF3872|nr:hypothetical protein [Mammaliicoccus lentus]MEB8093165.1 hypothetical protein [Mammaliicoccus lentus]
MTYYLDKLNKVFFIKFNSKVDIQAREELVKSFVNSVKEYKIIVLDHEDELVII